MRRRLDLMNGSIRQRAVRRPDTPCLSGFWRRQPEGLDEGPAKSQLRQIGALTCNFWSRLAGNLATATCADAVASGRRQARGPRVPLPSLEGSLKRAKQRANGARLPATPTDSQRQSPQVNGPSGHVQRRRNTQKIWFASRRPGVRVPLAPQVRVTRSGYHGTRIDGREPGRFEAAGLVNTQAHGSGDGWRQQSWLRDHESIRRFGPCPVRAYMGPHGER